MISRKMSKKREQMRSNLLRTIEKALRKGFEPLRGSRHNSSQGCRRGPLGYLSTCRNVHGSFCPGA
jgi:hypothetical protein